MRPTLKILMSQCRSPRPSPIKISGPLAEHIHRASTGSGRSLKGMIVSRSPDSPTAFRGSEASLRKAMEVGYANSRVPALADLFRLSKT